MRCAVAVAAAVVAAVLCHHFIHSWCPSFIPSRLCAHTHTIRLLHSFPISLVRTLLWLCAISFASTCCIRGYKHTQTVLKYSISFWQLSMLYGNGMLLAWTKRSQTKLNRTLYLCSCSRSIFIILTFVFDYIHFGHTRATHIRGEQCCFPSSALKCICAKQTSERQRALAHTHTHAHPLCRSKRREYHRSSSSNNKKIHIK